jgi:hypothetical protein
MQFLNKLPLIDQQTAEIVVNNLIVAALVVMVHELDHKKLVHCLRRMAII